MHLSWSRTKEATIKDLEKIVRKRYMSNRFQIQLKEDGNGSKGQSCLEVSGLSPMLH